jgi:hypothetical protein
VLGESAVAADSRDLPVVGERAGQVDRRPEQPDRDGDAGGGDAVVGAASRAGVPRSMRETSEGCPRYRAWTSRRRTAGAGRARPGTGSRSGRSARLEGTGYRIPFPRPRDVVRSRRSRPRRRRSDLVQSPGRLPWRARGKAGLHSRHPVRAVGRSKPAVPRSPPTVPVWRRRPAAASPRRPAR